MSWYYAENNERRGPVEDPAFDELVRAGKIQPATLVWRDGMANWTAFSEVGYIAPPPPDAPEALAPTGGVEMGMCSESGRILPRNELVEIDGRLVSAEYKNIVLQRIREGVSSGGAMEDPEAIARRIEETGWSISATSCVGRGWALVRENFWLTVGATFLTYLVIMAAGMVPFGGLVVQGPLMGGLNWMILKLLRREPAAVGDAFQGFNRGWGQLVCVSIIRALLAALCIVPGALVLIAAVVNNQSNPPIALLIVGFFVSLVGFCWTIYLSVAWIFALQLVADKMIQFWPAMRLSRRVVNMHWWQIFAVTFLTGLLMAAFMIVGFVIIALLVGASVAAKQNGLGISLGIVVGLVMAFGFFTFLPLMFASICVAYEDIFGARRAE